MISGKDDLLFSRKTLVHPANEYVQEEKGQYLSAVNSPCGGFLTFCTEGAALCSPLGQKRKLQRAAFAGRTFIFHSVTFRFQLKELLLPVAAPRHLGPPFFLLFIPIWLWLSYL
jgi:hypothetical protein